MSDHAAGDVGRTLAGRYRLLREIGRGGMGVVYEAEQLGSTRRVAAKVLRKNDERALARLRREAVSLAGLRSPHVVAVLDFQANEGEPPFLVMELLEGESLHAVMMREKAIAPARAVAIASQVLVALQAAHEAGLVHRDVKPSNVWLSPSREGEVAKLLDFGFVKDSGDSKFQTTAGTVLGTPAYAAPEQMTGTRVDHRADIHGVGVLLFVMLSGRRPFEPADVVWRVPMLEEHVPDLDPALGGIVARALEKDPVHRFQSATEMRDALARLDLRVPEEEACTVESAPERPRIGARRALLVAAGLVVIAGAFAFGAALERARRPRPARPPAAAAPVPRAADAGAL